MSSNPRGLKMLGGSVPTVAGDQPLNAVEHVSPGWNLLLSNRTCPACARMVSFPRWRILMVDLSPLLLELQRTPEEFVLYRGEYSNPPGPPPFSSLVLLRCSQRWRPAKG